MFRAFYNWCLDQEITSNDPFRRFSIGSQIYGTPIYISIEERDQIADADMGGNKHLETQRDIFIFQCLIGCRVSDLYSMTRDNIMADKRGTYIEYVPNKGSVSNSVSGVSLQTSEFCKYINLSVTSLAGACQ